MSKQFAVGQKVRFIEDYGYRVVKGDTGVVVGIRASYDGIEELVEVKLDKNGQQSGAYSRRLELVEAPLKVGDRITRVSNTTSFENLEAVVTGVNGTGNFIDFVVLKNDAKNTSFGPGKTANTRPASIYPRLEEAKAKAEEVPNPWAIKEEPLTPAVGDKVRYSRPGHRWIKDGYMPEGTVVTRRKGAIKVQWNTEKDNVTGSGFGTSSDEEYIKKHWEKIESFTPQAKFNKGDKVRFVKGNGWEGAEAEIVGDAKLSTWSANYMYPVKIVTQSEYSAKEGQTVSILEKNLEGIAEFTRKFKFKEGDTVKIVGTYLNGETGKVETIAKGALSYPYSLRLDSSGSLEAFNEKELEAYTPHALDGAKVGTTMLLHHVGKVNWVVTKLSEGKWRQININLSLHSQDLSEQGARNHFDQWDGRLVTA